MGSAVWGGAGGAASGYELSGRPGREVVLGVCACVCFGWG